MTVFFGGVISSTFFDAPSKRARGVSVVDEDVSHVPSIVAHHRPLIDGESRPTGIGLLFSAPRI